MKILIVDDNDDLRMVLGLMLSKELDLELFEASNGSEAVEIFIEELPDLVIMDIVMPIKDGIEATREIMKKYPDAKIIAHTAYSSLKGKEMIKEGALEVLSKPVMKNELLKKIEKYTVQT